MKKHLLLLVSLLLVQTVMLLAAPQKKSPWQEKCTYAGKDWEGWYAGTIPCADCEGQVMMILLNKDNTYEVKWQYMGKSKETFSRNGKIQWNKDGFSILLTEPGAKDSIWGKLSPGKLTLLDRSGKLISGKLASMYVLRKNAIRIEEKYWRLTELGRKRIPEDGSLSKEPFIYIAKDGLSFNGSTGCNSLMGKVEKAEPNKIIFSGLITTMMACPGMDFEAQFREALESTDHYVINGDELRFENAINQVQARFKADFSK